MIATNKSSLFSVSISHIVLGTGDPDAATAFLERIGYEVNSRATSIPNPSEKEHFVRNRMSKTVDMRLMRAPNGRPPIEILTEDIDYLSETNAIPSFELLIDDSTWPPIADNKINSANTSFHRFGIRQIDARLKRSKNLALAVYCPSLDETIDFWRCLGFAAELNDQGDVRVTFQRTLVGAGLELILLRSSKAPTITDLDQEGIVCLSLLCKDADAMQNHLVDKGYEPSHCFDLTPMGRSLKIFFVRGPGNAIYEFLSLAKN